jgi:hypothetical protein
MVNNQHLQRDIEEKNEKKPQYQREKHWFPASDRPIVVSTAQFALPLQYALRPPATREAIDFQAVLWW